MSLQVSKWLHVQALLDPEEMRTLVDDLSPFHMVIASAAVDNVSLSHEAFLTLYTEVINELKEGRIPDPQVYRTLFSTVWTLSEEIYEEMKVGERLLARLKRPGIQLRPHHLNYSLHDGEFRPMVEGPSSLFWGIQFSYPQLFQNPETGEIEKLQDENRTFFSTLQRWVRHNTRPTPFLVKGERINVPVRLGKKAFSWIESHPQLAPLELSVYNASHAGN